jgi:PAS domain S-box-containing protein
MEWLSASAQSHATMGSLATRAVIETDTQGVIRRWDAGAAILFGYTADEALDRPVDLIIPEHLRAAHWAGFHRAMREPVVKNLAADLPVLCADGEVRQLAGRLLVLSDGLGTALGALAIFTDQGSTGNRPFG